MTRLQYVCSLCTARNVSQHQFYKWIKDSMDRLLTQITASKKITSLPLLLVLPQSFTTLSFFILLKYIFTLSLGNMRKVSLSKLM
jgi:hypothetical protein